MSRATIFDIDGTLVDSVDLHAEAWRRAFVAFGKPLPFKVVREQIGKGGDQLLPALLTPEEVKAYGSELEEYRGSLFRKEYLPQVRPFLQVRELFQRLLDDGKHLALASSAKGAELTAYLKLANISDLVSIAVSADDVKQSKPAPDLFQVALERLRIRPDEATVVGDTPYDAEAAVRAGISPIGVLSGGFPEEALRKAGCREIHLDPADLLRRYSDSILSR